MEICLDEFCSKIIGNDMISKYEIEYVQYNFKIADLMSSKKEDRPNIFTVVSDSIYETNALSFIQMDKIGDKHGSDYLIKVIVKAKDGFEVICTSKWKKFKIGYPLLSIASHDKLASIRYFEEHIDTQSKRSIDMNEWLSFCSTSEIDLCLKDQKRAFHFMQYLSKKNGKACINQDDFTNFVCHDYYNMYMDDSRALIDKFKDKIKSISDIEDDYILVFC